MKNAIREELESALTITYTNDVLASGLAGSPATVSAGDVIKRGNLFYVSADTVLAGATGVANGVGRYSLAKPTATALAVGQSLGYDFSLKKVTTDLSGGVIGCVAVAAASNDTTVYVNMNVHARRSFAVRKHPSAGEDSANSMDVDCGFPVASALLQVTLQNSSGLQRPCTVIPKAGAGNENIITISDASLAATDWVNIHVIEGAGA